MPMGDQGFLSLMVADPRLAQLAIGTTPAWLWSTDGSRILWCNAAAAAALGIADPQSAMKTRSPADLHRRQILQLAGRLSLKGATRLERLRGFGAPLGGLMTCACARKALQDGNAAVLLVAMDAPKQVMALSRRLQFLADAAEAPVLIVTPDGTLAATNAAARDLTGRARNLADLGLESQGDSLFASPHASLDANGRHFEAHLLGAGHEQAVFAVVSAIAVAPEATAEAEAEAVTEIVAANDRILNEPLIDESEPETGPAPADTEDADPGMAPLPETLMTDDGSRPGETDKEPQIAPPAAPAAADRDAGPSAPASAEPAKTVRLPLRFLWRTDPDGRLTLDSDAFLQAAGSRTASVLGRTWREVATALDLDPQARIAEAVAKRETWNGILVQWPLDSANHATVELSGVPVFDAARTFAGYRGFGICRSLAPSPAAAMPAPAAAAPPAQPASDPAPDQAHAVVASASTPMPASPDEPVAPSAQAEAPKNVVQFRPAGDARTPSLSAVENRAFDEIARRLTQTFDIKPRQSDLDSAQPESSVAGDQPSVAPAGGASTMPESPAEPPAWLATASAPPRGDSSKDRMLLDLMPSGVLIYRLDRMLYANAAFLEQSGFASLSALQDAGGLDALYVEPGPASASSTSDDGMPLKIAMRGDEGTACDARLFSILWDNENAHALIVPQAHAASPASPKTDKPSAAEPAPLVAAAPPAPQPAAPQQPASGEFDAILENATDGIVLFDRSGAVTSSNRSAQDLFNIPATDFLTQNVADLFAADSQRIVLDYFESIDQQAMTTPADHGREVLGRTRIGGFVPLSMTMGKIGHDGERFFAVFRDLSQLKKSESDLLFARRKAERASVATSDALARISHEVRGPLNTIIGFANVMLEERFGTLGNDRYGEYLKDIRASGERAIAIVDDLVNITSIETGNVELKLVSQNLNEMVEQCVGALQPQANRERVIIRTSLAHALPQVLADNQALRQITMNLITSSIRFSKAGGQVIVSTAAADNGGAVLRVRDTGRGLSEAELASAMEPQRIAPPSDRIGSDRSGIDLSLARALAEANRARFQIRSSAQTGTLIEVAFPSARALAG
jgi:PAS domain S-box-containing protein